MGKSPLPPKVALGGGYKIIFIGFSLKIFITSKFKHSALGWAAPWLNSELWAATLKPSALQTLPPIGPENRGEGNNQCRTKLL